MTCLLLCSVSDNFLDRRGCQNMLFFLSLSVGYHHCLQKWSAGYKSWQKYHFWKSYKAAECLHKVSELESDTDEARSTGL